MDVFGRHVNFDTHGFTWPGGPEYEPPPSPRCRYCGAFLPLGADASEPWEDAVDCDGTAKGIKVEHEGEILAILGPGSYTEWYSACGVVEGPHAPHREVLAAGYTFRTRCRRCDKENVEQD